MAEPVKHYPSLFHEGTIWDQFPYLLPNLVVVMFLLSSCIVGFFRLEEVHPRFRDQIDIRWTLMRRIRNVLTGNGWETHEDAYTPIRTDEIEAELPLPRESSTESPEEHGIKPRSAFTRQIKLQILSIAIQGFLKIATLTIVPVFLATLPQPDEPSSSTRGLQVVKSVLGIKGGFGLDTMSISNVLLSQAVAAIGGQILVVPAIISRHGPLHSYRVVVAILFCLYCVFPFTASWSTWTGLPSILIIMWVYAVASGLAITCSAILYVSSQMGGINTHSPAYRITNTVPSPIYLATVNGAAASLGCLARTLGPAVSGPLFRLGLQTGYVGLPFWLLGAITGLGGIVSLYLVDHI